MVRLLPNRGRRGTNLRSWHGAGPCCMEDTASRSTPPPLPSLADGKFHLLDPNMIPVGRIGMAITSLVLLGIGVIFLMFVSFSPGISGAVKSTVWWGWVALVPILGIYSWIWPGVSYRYTFYCLKDDCLIFRRGVFWKMETLVPKSRVQHTDISQGPVQRAYAISDLIIHTAGTRYALVTVNGLPRSLAPQLRDHLLDRIDDRTL
jgi:uncharacterized protein